MLWDYYVFRRGPGAHDLWDELLKNRPAKILYIAGRGFDVRAQTVMREFVSSQVGSGRCTAQATLLLVEFNGYELDDNIVELTEQNAIVLEQLFAPLGKTKRIINNTDSDDDVRPSAALRFTVEAVLSELKDVTDIVLDVSSLPRVTYLTLLTSLLHHLIPSKEAAVGQPHPLHAGGVNFQVLVAEDAGLDAEIRAEDPNNELVFIPGFSSALQAESVQDWQLVWFPILGENRVNQLQKIIDAAMIPPLAEVCPVLPHPSKNPRRADNLLVEYRGPLFDSRKTPTSNIIYAHESHPFEAYRQIFGAMRRYKNSMKIMGGCRLVVTPLGSKLITIGAGLACFEMRPVDLNDKYGVAIPHAEPRRYVASAEALQRSEPEVSVLLLTGLAYG